MADAFFVALLCVLVFTPLSVKLLGDAGIGWHIRTGQQILATHAIPRVDSFSSSRAGQPWFAWEWLYDVIVGWLESAMGLNGVVWLTAMLIAAVFAWLFRLLIVRGANLFAAFTLVLLATGASMVHALARPHVLSWLFTLAWFWILSSAERSEVGAGRVWALPPLMMLWVNIHGGFLVGFVLLGIFWVAAVWRAKNNSRFLDFAPWRANAPSRFARNDNFGAQRALRARDLAGVGLLSAAASLVNPYGWQLHRHIYAYLSNRFLMDHIDEFQSPNFHGVAQKCFLALLLIALAVVWRRGGELRVSEGLTVLFAVYAGLYATRNIPVASILLVMIAGPMISASESGGRSWVREFSRRMTAVELGLCGHVWAVLAMIATLCVAANGGHVGKTTWMDAHFDAKRMPVEAVDYVKSHPMPGPVLGPDYWGGYLIYRLYPGTRVVLDDRHDFYGEEFIASYLKMIHGERGWDEFLKQNPAGYFMLPSDAALTNLMLETREWSAVYRDDLAVVLVREEGSER